MMRELQAPNICSSVGAALRELRNWHAAMGRAQHLGMAPPEAFVLFAAATSIYRQVFESSSCSTFLHAKWVSMYNSIDPPNQGSNLTYMDVVNMNE